MRKQLNNYVSELDQFLNEFDQHHPELSASQLAEIKKHKKVAELRDNEQRKEDESFIWSEF